MRNYLLAGLLPTLIATALLGLPQPTLAQEVEPIDSIVALVEDDVVLRSELDDSIDRIVGRIRAQGGNVPPRSVLETQVLERVILNKLQVQRALRTGIRVSDADIDQALMTVAQQNGISVAQLRDVIESEGEDFSEFRRNLGEEIIMERLRQRVVSSMDPVSDTEIDILLTSEDFAGGEFDISHILIAVPDGSTPNEVQAAQVRIEQVEREIQGGMDFATAAINYSQSQEALEGGRVGWRDLNSIPREFAEGIRDLKPGDVTKPIRSPSGFHLVRVNDHRENRQIMITEFRASHIMIKPNELVSPRQAMEKTRKLHNELTDGADFAELAKENSDDTTSANIGGDMGWFPAQGMGERFQVTLETLADGEISEPFQTQEGWHIIQRTGYRETDVTEEAMRNMARQTIMQRRADSEIESYLRQLREDAFVEERLSS